MLSRRAWLEETQKEQREDFLANLKPGEVRSGVVSSVVNFGAFVDLGGMDGLIHVSELSWKHVDHPGSVVAVGDEVTVQVLDVDLDRERISLSLKATQQDPWQEFATSHRVGELVYGRVTKLVPFGSFVQVGEGIEGLVHISEMSAHHVDLPEQVVTPGEELWVKIIDLDLQRRRISLSIKQAAEGGVVAAEYQEHFGEHAVRRRGQLHRPGHRALAGGRGGLGRVLRGGRRRGAGPRRPRRPPAADAPAVEAPAEPEAPAAESPAAEAPEADAAAPEQESVAVPTPGGSPARRSARRRAPASRRACSGIGLAPLSDNSFLTHLATGRLIIDLGHIPATDPYTFTAHGPRLGGAELAGVARSSAGPTTWPAATGVRARRRRSLTVAVFAVVWRLSVRPRACWCGSASAALAIGVGAERSGPSGPLLVGLLAARPRRAGRRGRARPPLAPPGRLGLGEQPRLVPARASPTCVVVALGRRLDHLDASVELRCLRWLRAAILLGAVNPLGPAAARCSRSSSCSARTCCARSSSGRRPPSPSLGQRVFLAAGRRWPSSPSSAGPGTATRSSWPCSSPPRCSAPATSRSRRIVLVPVLAEAWPTVGPPPGRRAGRHRPARSAPSAWLAVVLVVGRASCGEPALRASTPYPMRSLRQLDRRRRSTSRRCAWRRIDRVGNLLELRDGPGRRVFFDDRFDMFPDDGHRGRLRRSTPGRPRSHGRARPLAASTWCCGPATGALAADPRRRRPSWRSLYDDDEDWVLFCRVGRRRSAAELGTC